MTQIAQAPLPQSPEPSLLNPHTTEALVIGLILVSVTVAVFFLARPLFRAWARRVEFGGKGGVLPEEVEQLRDQVGELPVLRERVHELEERMEFTERLLAQRRDQELLPRQGDG